MDDWYIFVLKNRKKFENGSVLKFSITIPIDPTRKYNGLRNSYLNRSG